MVMAHLSRDAAFIARTAAIVVLACPSVLLDLGAGLADLVARLGWLPPTRSTALAEMRRDVTGDPTPWIAATASSPYHSNK